MSARLIATQYSGTCLSCDEPIEVGARVWWLKDVGMWHSDCSIPPNVIAHQRAADRRRELGIDAPEFGKAPLLKRRGE